MSDQVGLIKLGLIFGLALALLGYELWSIRKTIAADRATADKPVASDDATKQP